MRNKRISEADGATAAGVNRLALALTAAAMLAGCSNINFNNPLSTAPPLEEEIPTITERFDQVFGGRGKVAETAADGTEVDCPQVKVRAGASTYGVAPPGHQAVASELNFQATITRAARECRRLPNGQISARVGVQGRVIAGPAGAPASVEVPLRMAIVRTGVQEQVITTKVYRTTVSMSEGGGAFSVVGEDMIYNQPNAMTSDNFVFYIGFDPQAVTPAAPARRRR